MSDIGIGTILDALKQRDAIHVAVAPVVAGCILNPGQHVGLVNGKAMGATKCVGIVDPFLPEPVKEGQRFYMFLYPNSVTSLRHEWTHPAFGDVDSVQWLRNYAADHNPYDEAEKAYNRLVDGLKTGELFFHGSDLHGLYELDDADELKYHAERVLGIDIDWGRFEFSCSC